MSLTPLDRNAARHSFERAAASYDQHAVLQCEVASRLLERVAYHRLEPGVILDLGCGTGSGSRSLSSQFTHAQVIALDWSAAMLAQVGKGNASAQASAKGPVRLCADMHALPLAARSFDLVFSSLALQWSYDFPGLFSELRRVMRPGAMLIFTCYGPDTLFELKQAWQSVDEHQHVNAHPDMHDIGDELLAAGFQEPVMDVEHLILEYPDVVSLMRELKSIGEQNVASERERGLTGKKRFRGMLDAYEKFGRNDKYPASYEVIYGTAFAPVEGQPLRTQGGEVVTFSVDALRSKSAVHKKK